MKKLILGTYALLVAGVITYEHIPEWLGKTCLLGTCVFTMVVPLAATLESIRDSNC